ncbi:MAG: hypothetical protein JWP34_5316 [Massilia sp.]|nr:hypothetical protein [Massilia sp.]
MFRFFESFIAKMASGFRRMAYATKQEVTVQDLHSEAWIVASEISEKRGKEIDFSDPADQNLIMGYVYTKKVTRRDRYLSSAVRIDQEVEGEDGAPKLVAQLKAHSSSDPLKQLVRRENAMEAEAKLRASYSQAAAYFHTFTRFKHDRERVRLHLLISSLVLTRRMNVAQATTLVQPSLFDGKQRITSRFKAEPGRPYVVRVERHLPTAQWGWDFEEGGQSIEGAEAVAGLAAMA